MGRKHAEADPKLWSSRSVFPSTRSFSKQYEKNNTFKYDVYIFERNMCLTSFRWNED